MWMVLTALVIRFCLSAGLSHDGESSISAHLALNAMDIEGLDGAKHFISEVSRLDLPSRDQINIMTTLFIDGITWQELVDTRNASRIISMNSESRIGNVTIVPNGTSAIGLDESHSKVVVKVYTNNNKLRDRRRGMRNPIKEHVTNIIEVLRNINATTYSREDDTFSTKTLLLSFLRGHIPFPTTNFDSLLRDIQHFDLMLLGEYDDSTY